MRDTISVSQCCSNIPQAEGLKQPKHCLAPLEVRSSEWASRSWKQDVAGMAPSGDPRKTLFLAASSTSTTSLQLLCPHMVLFSVVQSRSASLLWGLLWLCWVPFWYSSHLKILITSARSLPSQKLQYSQALEISTWILLGVIFWPTTGPTDTFEERIILCMRLSCTVRIERPWVPLNKYQEESPTLSQW